MTTSKSGPTGVGQRHRKACPQDSPCRCPWGYYAKVQTPGGAKQFTKTGYTTQKEAKEARAAILEQHRTHVLTMDRKTTVAVWLERWYADRTINSERPLRPTTARSYRAIIDRHLTPRLGALRLADLRPEHIESMLRGIKADHPEIGPSSRRGIYAVLRSALTKAHQKKMIATNPCTAVDKDVLPSADRPEVKPWEPEELGAFLDAKPVVESRLRPLFEVAAFTGMRRGELAGLRWVDVDLDAARVKIQQQAVQVGHQVVIGPPKSRSGVRVLDLADDTVAVLRSWKAKQTAERLAWGEAWVDTGLVFTDEQGNGYHPERLSKSFTRLTKAAGVRVVRFHDIRHGAASLQLAAGADMAVVSKRLGHSQISMTIDTYSHMIGTVGKQAAEASIALVPRANPAGG